MLDLDSSQDVLSACCTHYVLISLHLYINVSREGVLSVLRTTSRIRELLDQSLICEYVVDRGLYGGMGMHLLRSVPNTAIMFLSFELVSNWLDRQAASRDGEESLVTE